MWRSVRRRPTRTLCPPTSSCTPLWAREWRRPHSALARLPPGAAASGAAATPRAPEVSVFGLDVGTSAVKGLALDGEGGVVAAAEASYPLSTPRPGWAEQDPEDWWRAAAAVLAQLGAAAGPPEGIGLSGQMHGLVALDSDDRVLRPAILWNDQRTV